MRRLLILFSILGYLTACSMAAKTSSSNLQPQTAGIDCAKLAAADTLFGEAIAAGDIPGAVLGVVHNGTIVYLKAYGNRQVYPDTVAMTVNTVFDLASVSKPVATATSVMLLMEQGKLRLMDDVALYIPDFKGWTDSLGRKSPIRIVHLLTHTSGLPPYAPVDELKKIYSTPNPDGLIKHISTVQRNNPPGEVFDYSCLNYITLQRIVETISALSLQVFAQRHIFTPLGMKHTDYNPVGETLALTAPTTRQPDGSVLKGVVHDPLARELNGGVSGNAGVFSNAEDLARFAAMLLNDGKSNNKQFLGQLTVKAMTRTPHGFETFGRSLGWDLYSDYEHDGDIFGALAYGHTGYTGTSMTLDPETKTAVIILTNRVHPDDKGAVNRLRDVVANVVAGAVF